MCLTNCIRIRNKEGGLKTYKFFVLSTDSPDEEGVFESPFFKELWIPGETHHVADYDEANISGERLFEEVLRMSQERDIITGPAYHSYSNLTDAMSEAVDFYKDHDFCRRVFVAECTIPEESEYVYQGIDNYDSNNLAYASQMLRFDRVLCEINRDIATKVTHFFETALELTKEIEGND